MKKNKFLKTLTIFGAAACAPLLLTGCKEKENKTDFRVYNGYIQTTTDGNNWENLIALEDIKGEDGTDAIQYTIGADGYWYINGNKTNKKAVGEDGVDGEKGADGEDGKNGLNPYIGSNGNWWIGNEDTEVRAGLEISKIEFVEHITNSTMGGKHYDTYKITYKDGTYTSIKIESKVFKISYKENTPQYLKDKEIYLENLIGYQEIENLIYGSTEAFAGEWLGENIRSFEGTNLEPYFLGWFIEGTDIEITKYSNIGANVTLKAKWDEENMQKYFYHGISSFIYNEEENCYEVTLDTENYHYNIIPEYYNDGEHGELIVKSN